MNEILKSIKRTPYQSLASFMILFFTLFLSLFFFSLTSFSYGFLSYVETKPEVTVYFDTKTKEADILKIRDTMTKSGKVSDINYTSQEDALKIYRELQKNIVDKLITVTSIMRHITMFIFLFLILISFIVLMTTTAFKIALKKDEIELLQLLGASNGYIRQPFLLEGLTFGFVSATVAFVLFYGIFFYLQPFLNSYLNGISTLPFYNFGDLGLYVWPPSMSYILISFLATSLFGMAIGLFGNLIATSKYIKS